MTTSTAPAGPGRAHRVPVRPLHVRRQRRERRCRAAPAPAACAIAGPNRRVVHSTTTGAGAAAPGRGTCSGKPSSRAGLGTAERVDRLVRVADRDEGRRRRRRARCSSRSCAGSVSCSSSTRTRRYALAQLRLHRRVVGEQRGAVHHLGVVADALEVEHLRGTPRGTHRSRARPARASPPRAPSADQVPGVQAQRAGPGDAPRAPRRPARGCRARREPVRPVQPAVADRVGQQLAQPLLLLRARQQAQRRRRSSSGGCARRTSA